MLRHLIGRGLAIALFSLLPLSLTAAGDSDSLLITVTKIIDGDSVNGKTVRLRLHGIDAPEMGQECHDRRGAIYDCGVEAKSYLETMIHIGSQIKCDVVDIDRYRRIVARCQYHQNDRQYDISKAMVANGWALAYRRYSKDYVAEEQDAQKSKKGVWQGCFTPPEIWRRQ